AGLRPVRAARSAFSKLRKPGIWTLPPPATVLVTTSSNAASTAPTEAAGCPVFSASAFTSSALFIGALLRAVQPKGTLTTGRAPVGGWWATDRPAGDQHVPGDRPVDPV